MTLILAYMSEDHAVLVSDRRATWVEGKKRVWVDDENKAIVLGGALLMGYTGLARLDDQRVDQWVVEQLADVDPRDYLTSLKGKTQAAIDRMGVPKRLSGHAFIAVGFLSDAAGAPVPVAFEVSNALIGKHGAWVPSRNWAAARGTLDGQPFKLGAYGAPPSEARLRECVRLIGRYRKNRPGRVIGVVEHMVRLAREVAVREPGVSADLSVSVFPRAAFPASDSTIQALKEPVLDVVTLFLPGPETAVRAGTIYGPATISPGYASFGLEVRVGAAEFIGPRRAAGPPAGA